jgi:hypothetical protein
MAAIKVWADQKCVVYTHLQKVFCFTMQNPPQKLPQERDIAWHSRLHVVCKPQQGVLHPSAVGAGPWQCLSYVRIDILCTCAAMRAQHSIRRHAPVPLQPWTQSTPKHLTEGEKVALQYAGAQYIIVNQKSPRRHGGRHAVCRSAVNYTGPVCLRQ